MTTRTDGMPASKAERHLRRLLAMRSGIPHVYSDDGEASGSEHGISIDFMREPVADIEAKLQALSVARIEQAAKARQDELREDAERIVAACNAQSDMPNSPVGVDSEVEVETDPPLRLQLLSGFDLAVNKATVGLSITEGTTTSYATIGRSPDEGPITKADWANVLRLAADDLDPPKQVANQIPELPRGWRVEAIGPWSALTDEANAERRWLVERTEAPYSGRTGSRSWYGPTLHETFQRAHKDLKLPFPACFFQKGVIL